jgi:hypothetical protein
MVVVALRRFAWAHFAVLALSLAWGLPAPASAADDIVHLLTYGQSVTIGWGAHTPLSTTQRYDSLMFNAGVRTLDGGEDQAATHTSLVPLVEQDFWALGETPTAGALDMINALQRSERSIAFDQDGVRYLGSAPGKGGMTIRQLSLGSKPFYQLIYDVFYGYYRALATGGSYRIGAVLWGQGESDEYWHKDPEQYIAELEQLREDVEWVQSAYKGTQETVPLIAYQMASHIMAGSKTPSIALATLEAARRYPDIYVATPMYPFDYVDGFHPTAASNRALGAYYGLAYTRIVRDGVDWKPLQPEQTYSWGGSVMAIRFHVPQPPLVLDRDWVSDPGNAGFSLVDPQGNDNPLIGVAIGGGNLVWFAAERVIEPGSKIRYGWNGGANSGRTEGPRGNLRDSQGDTIVFDPDGIKRPMHNWCVLFEMAVPGSN